MEDHSRRRESLRSIGPGRMRNGVHFEVLATMADSVRDGVQDVRSRVMESMGGASQRKQVKGAPSGRYASTRRRPKLP